MAQIAVHLIAIYIRFRNPPFLCRVRNAEAYLHLASWYVNRINPFHKLAALPRGSLTFPEWIYAVGALSYDAPAVDALLVAVDAMTQQPSFDEVISVARVMSDLNRVVERERATRKLRTTARSTIIRWSGFGRPPKTADGVTRWVT